MKRISLTNLAHQAVASLLQAGDFAIDATVGNGHDTVFLADRVGPTGRVYGFDIQQAALDASRQRLQAADASSQATLIKASHALINEKIDAQFHGRIRAVMFNLGYLPGADKNIITRSESTLAALQQSIELLANPGILTIMVYPGHAGGDDEAVQVESCLSFMDQQKYRITTHYSQVDKPEAPRLYIVETR